MTILAKYLGIETGQAAITAAMKKAHSFIDNYKFEALRNNVT